MDSILSDRKFQNGRLQRMPRGEYAEWVRFIPAGTCLFCEQKYQRVIRPFEYWYWTESIAPYAAFQTLLVTKRHILLAEEMTDEEWHELRECVQYIIGQYERAGIQRVRQLQHTRIALIRAVGVFNPNAHYHIQFMRYEEGDLDPVMLETAWQQDLIGLFGAHSLVA